MMTVKDSSIPTPEGRCLLFSLPRELRDEIYKYALWFPEGLWLNLALPSDGKWSEIRFFKNIRQLVPEKAAINPLELVCRTFYTEARGLIFRCNDIHIWRSSWNECIDQWKELLRICPDHIRNDLRQIYLHPRNLDSGWIYTLSDLGSLAKSQTNRDIRITINLRYALGPLVDADRLISYVTMEIVITACFAIELVTTGRLVDIAPGMQDKFLSTWSDVLDYQTENFRAGANNRNRPCA